LFKFAEQNRITHKIDVKLHAGIIISCILCLKQSAHLHKTLCDITTKVKHIIQENSNE